MAIMAMRLAILAINNGNNNGHYGNDHGHSLQMRMAIYGHYNGNNKMATIAIIPIMANTKGQFIMAINGNVNGHKCQMIKWPEMAIRIAILANTKGNNTWP